MFCEGMTMMAIARVLNIPYQTVRTCYTLQYAQIIDLWIRREGEKALKRI